MIISFCELHFATMFDADWARKSSASTTVISAKLQKLDERRL